MLYRKYANYYDYVYAWKTYSKDVKVIRRIIYNLKRSKGNSLLEVGCGTGNYLRYFSKGFSCTGLDISEKALDIARKKASGVKFIRGDMLNMELNQKFDIILSLWGVISYAKTYQNLAKTLKNFSNHLNVGGVLIADPWYTTMNEAGKTEPYYKDGKPYMTTYDSTDLKICRMRIPKTYHDRQVMDISTLVARKGAAKVEYFVDRYDVGLFDAHRVLQMLTHLGIDAQFKKDSIGNGAYVGVKVH